MLIDLHVHTLKSSDSSLEFGQLAREARRVGLDAVCVTEHDVCWDWGEIEALSRRHGVRAFPGIEVSTELGHVAVFGLRQYRSGMAKIGTLRRIVTEEGGFMIAMHPFRRLFEREAVHRHLFAPAPGADPEPAAAAAHDLFALVDDLEVGNGANTVAENHFACEVARRLGRPGTAGSDAHSTHGLGCFVTRFEQPLDTPLDLVRELRAGRYAPHQGLLQGRLRPLRCLP